MRSRSRGSEYVSSTLCCSASSTRIHSRYLMRSKVVGIKKLMLLLMSVSTLSTLALVAAAARLDFGPQVKSAQRLSGEVVRSDESRCRPEREAGTKFRPRIIVAHRYHQSALLIVEWTTQQTQFHHQPAVLK